MPEFSGEILNAGEAEFFSVSMVAGRQYYFELEGAPTAQGSLSDGVLRLSRGGSEVGFDDDGGVGLNSRLVFTATQTGTYQIEVTGFFDSTGTYRLRAFEDDFKSTVEGTGSTGPAQPGGSSTGTINYGGDVDLFRPTLIDGLTYAIEMRGQGAGAGSLPDSLLNLFDPAGILVAVDDDSGAGFDAMISYTADSSGAHSLETRAFGDEDTGTYRLLISEGIGTGSSESITGLGTHDAMNAAGGNDTILGGAGNDTMTGGAGSDRLRGQAGGDVLRGGNQSDVLVGGAGNDVFDFDLSTDTTPAQRDVIRAGDGATAFQGAGGAAGDRIDLTAIDANVSAAGNQAFVFGGSGRGHVSVVNSGSNTVVHANTDGDVAFEFELVVEDGGINASAYSAADFFL